MFLSWILDWLCCFVPYFPLYRDSSHALKARNGKKEGGFDGATYEVELGSPCRPTSIMFFNEILCTTDLTT